VGRICAGAMLILLWGPAYSTSSPSTAAGLGDTETRGSIDIWHFFSNLNKYVEELKEMAGVVGIDHVSIGTDQQVAPSSLQETSAG